MNDLTEDLAHSTYPVNSARVEPVAEDVSVLTGETNAAESGQRTPAPADPRSLQIVQRNVPESTDAVAPSAVRPNSFELVQVLEKPVTTVPGELLALGGNAYRIATDLTPPSPGIPTAKLKLTEAVPQMPPDQVARPQATPEIAFAGYVSTEEELRLNRQERWRTQLRLALIGHDPRGIDGIFGDGTRKAIADLQAEASLPSTGYLDETTLALLKRKSQPGYQRWLERRAAKRAERKAAELAAASAPQQVSSAPTARRAPACARDSKGIIISNQSFGCDWNVLREGLQSLFGSS